MDDYRYATDEIRRKRARLKKIADNPNCDKLVAPKGFNVSEEQNELIRLAASYSRSTQSSFMRRAALEEALAIIFEQEGLSEADKADDASKQD